MLRLGASPARLSFGPIAWLFAIALSTSVPESAVSFPIDDPPLDPAAVDRFEDEVRPLLVARCYECHSREAGEAGGGLLLDSRDGWQRGGELGPAIVPGEADRSWLIRAVRPHDDALQMPPDSALSPAEIAVLERWIAQGAVDPRRETDAVGTAAAGIDLEQGRAFWSFRPVDSAVSRTVDAMSDEAASFGERFRPEDRIDWAIASRWSAAGVTPASEASRADLIRRAAIDLTGLPPSYDEVQAFVADERPDAWERAIDRLLASPRYGERWGRHWLDVARYADSNGMDENIAHGNAWRYRDWVVRALNRDLGYDRFVTLQLAGDRLPPTDDEQERIDRTIATGFLSLGPKVLAEVDETKMEMDIIDEQVETTGRALLAMTFGCARCHDHKFDPIGTRDYYALAGIFKSTRTMEHFTKIAKWNEVSIESSVERETRLSIESRLTELTSEIEAVVAEADGVLRQTLVDAGELTADGELPADKRERYRADLAERLATLEAERRQAEGNRPLEPTAMSVSDAASPVDLAICIRGNHLTLGEKVPRGIPAVFVSADAPAPAMPTDASGRLELAAWIVDPANPLTDRVWVNRLWRWHLGRGIVSSTDNFGLLGDQPTHPELLDDLVLRFRDHDRSTKWFHRTLMRSATYRRGAIPDGRSAELDPDNRWLARHSVRRLESEAIRDAMLAAAGNLDLKIGGSLLHVGNREFLFDHTSKDNTRYDAPVRSLYLPVIRNHLYDLFGLFDSSDAAVPVGSRDETVVPNQALFLLNSPLVDQAARSLVEQSRHEAGDDPTTRIEWLFRQVLGRDATRREVERFVAALGDSEPAADEPTSDDERWTMLAQTLLISNEMLHVR